MILITSSYQTTLFNRIQIIYFFSLLCYIKKTVCLKNVEKILCQDFHPKFKNRLQFRLYATKTPILVLCKDYSCFLDVSKAKVNG